MLVLGQAAVLVPARRASTMPPFVAGTVGLSFEFLAWGCWAAAR